MKGETKPGIKQHRVLEMNNNFNIYDSFSNVVITISELKNVKIKTEKKKKKGKAVASRTHL